MVKAQRKKDPKTDEYVLKKSKRRCCLCFGLNCDSMRKRGQIAHLDHDPTNDKLGNLAFLCLDHHDEYDSKTSQSKSIQTNEVKAYRDNLYHYIVSGKLLDSEIHEKSEKKNGHNKIFSYLRCLYNDIGLFVQQYYDSENSRNSQVSKALHERSKEFVPLLAKYELSLSKEVYVDITTFFNLLLDYKKKIEGAVAINRDEAAYKRWLAINIEFYKNSAPMLERLKEYLRGSSPVVLPHPSITSDVVERALNDAETLIEKHDATSGVDRVHTAFHGFLRAICDAVGIAVSDDANMPTLLAVIRDKHPKFAVKGPRDEEITRIIRSLSTIVDALNTIRNRASVAHPNPKLLGAPEAMLMVNVVRSLLHYLDTKLNEPSA